MGVNKTEFILDVFKEIVALFPGHGFIDAKFISFPTGQTVDNARF